MMEMQRPREEAICPKSPSKLAAGTSEKPGLVTPDDSFLPEPPYPELSLKG